MLLNKSTSTLTFDHPVLKVLKLSTAINGYIYITTTEDSVEKLVHVNKQGKVLWERDYADSVDTFGMFNEREVIAMNVKEHLIEVIDLLTHTIKSYPHQYAFEDTSSMDLLVFGQSKLFCIVQKGSLADVRFFLTYYSYEQDNVKQISAYKSQQGEWAYEQEYAKVNNHSKVAWWRPKHEGTIQFATFSLLENHSGDLGMVKVNNTLGRDYNHNNLGIEIAQMWEITPHVYMLVCNSNREAKKEEAAPNNNYVLDVRKEIIRQAKFSFPDRWNTKLLDYFYLGEISVFHTFGFEKGQPLSTPVYYVHNQREEIVATEEWKATSRVHFYIPGFDNSTIIEAYHENGDVASIEVTTKKLMTRKEIYLHFMLHINEDFDDDLLQDAVELLTE